MRLRNVITICYKIWLLQNLWQSVTDLVSNIWTWKLILSTNYSVDLGLSILHTVRPSHRFYVWGRQVSIVTQSTSTVKKPPILWRISASTNVYHWPSIFFIKVNQFHSVWMPSPVEHYRPPILLCITGNLSHRVSLPCNPKSFLLPIYRMM